MHINQSEGLMGAETAIYFRIFGDKVEGFTIIFEVIVDFREKKLK